MQRSLITPAKQTALNNALIEAIAKPNNLDDILDLIQKGADVNCYDRNGMTPLAIAIKRGMLNYFNVLINKGGDVHARIGHHRTGTLLIVAANSNRFEMCKLLLQKNVDPNILNGEPNTALHFALYFGFQNVCRLLLENGADPLIMCGSQKSPLQYIYTTKPENKNEIIDILLTYLAKKYEITEDEAIILEIKRVNDCCDKTLYEKFESILSRTSPPNPDELNQALYEAIKKGNEKLILRLMEKGANPISALKEGDSCLSRAALLSDLSLRDKVLTLLLKQLAQKHFTEPTPSIVAISIIHPDLKPQFEFALQNIKNAKLIEAAGVPNPDKVAELIQQGADINSEDQYRVTPIYQAAKHGCIENVELLLTHKPKLISGDNRPHALRVAAKRGHTEICKLLIEAGADTNCSRHRTRPLHFSVKTGNVELCRLLLENKANPLVDINNILTLARNLKDKEASKQIIKMLIDAIFDCLIVTIDNDMHQIGSILEIMQSNLQVGFTNAFIIHMLDKNWPNDKIISVIMANPGYFKLDKIKNSICDSVKYKEPAAQRAYITKLLTDKTNLFHCILAIPRRGSKQATGRFKILEKMLKKIPSTAVIEQTPIATLSAQPVAVPHQAPVTSASAQVAQQQATSLFPSTYQRVYPLLTDEAVSAAPPSYEEARQSGEATRVAPASLNRSLTATYQAFYPHMQAQAFSAETTPSSYLEVLQAEAAPPSYVQVLQEIADEEIDNTPAPAPLPIPTRAIQRGLVDLSLNMPSVPTSSVSTYSPVSFFNQEPVQAASGSTQVKTEKKQAVGLK